MRTSLFIMTLAATLMAGPLRADDFPGSIPAEIATAAKDLLTTIDSVKQTSVEVGQFVPVGNSRANGGPGVRLELIQALERLRKGIVRDEAPLALQGKFLQIDDPGNKSEEGQDQVPLVAEKLTLELIDKSTGEPIIAKPVFIRRLRDIAAIEGVVAHIDPDADSRGQNNELRKAKQHPDGCVDDDATTIRSKSGSPYSLQIAVKKKDDGKEVKAAPRKATIDKGQPFVNIDKGELYELVFHNQSDEEVGVSIKIDGIDVFTFSDDRNPKTEGPKFTHYIVAKQSNLTLPGWHKTNDAKRNDNFLSFLVTEYGKGAASKFPTQAQGNIGVITIAVGKSHAAGGKAKSGAETGFGPPVKGDVKEVQRLVDPPHDFISVRYLRQ